MRGFAKGRLDCEGRKRVILDRFSTQRSIVRSGHHGPDFAAVCSFALPVVGISAGSFSTSSFTYAGVDYTLEFLGLGLAARRRRA